MILDTETTGLDENKDEVIEIGCILFDVSFKCVLSQVSFLFPVNNNEAEYVNGISAEVTNISQPWEDGLNFFLKLVDEIRTINKFQKKIQSIFPWLRDFSDFSRNTINMFGFIIVNWEQK